MGISNIKRLKKRFNIKRDDGTTDKYFDLIDKVFYDKIIYAEEYDEEHDVMKWQFEDGKSIFMNSNEIVNLLLFLMDLEDEIIVIVEDDKRRCIKNSNFFNY